MTFEENFARLEEIIRALEDGRSTLSESLSMYEEGVKLLKSCHETLTDARRKVEKLTGLDENGNPVVEAWSDDDNRTLEEKAETRGR